jgi:hypothetical protein
MAWYAIFGLLKAWISDADTTTRAIRCSTSENSTQRIRRVRRRWPKITQADTFRSQAQFGSPKLGFWCSALGVTQFWISVAERKSRHMMKTVLSMTLVCAASANIALAQDAKVSVGTAGIGGMSCAHWRSTKERLAEGTVWIYGFWTGLNYVAAASEQAQSGTDTAAMVAAVKRQCAQEPAQTLASAVWTSYLEFNKR